MSRRGEPRSPFVTVPVNMGPKQNACRQSCSFVFDPHPGLRPLVWGTRGSRFEVLSPRRTRKLISWRSVVRCVERLSANGA